MTDLTIEAMGARGEGIARRDGAPVYVPYALPGERVRVDVKGDRGRLIEVLEDAPDRVVPDCPHYLLIGI